MSALEKIYNRWAEDWCELHGISEPPCYDKWLHDDFEYFIGKNLSDYEACLIYNEMMQDKHLTMWENIENISEIYGDDFLHVYSLIDHNKFNIYDDIIIEENCLIVSYTYKDFLDNYWDIDAIVEYIDKKGLENLINKNLILDKVNVKCYYINIRR